MNAHSQFKRTRIAPTPSGFLHLGNILSFIITVALAKKHNASILLRIDDLDQSRAQDHYIQDIFDTLNFLELPWDEGPRNLREFKQEYSQIHRLPLYTQMLDELKDKNLVFACNCSRSQLQQSAPQGVYPGTCIQKNIPLNSSNINWRLITNCNKKLQTNFLESENSGCILPEDLHHFVVRKKDGMPAYQLSSVADDIHFDVDLIIRGMDLKPSSIAQLYLANELGHNTFTSVHFLHHPLIKDGNGEKLSKSAGSTSIQYLRKEGKKKEDIYNLLAQLAGIPADGIYNCQSFASVYF